MKKALSCLFFLNIFLICEASHKIVGLMAVRNEEDIVEQSLRSLAMYTDAIVVLDDASVDHTLAMVQELADQLHIEKIITKKVWRRDERADKQALLDAGREIGGTHFIMLDADEMFTANCLKDSWLCKKILALEKGQGMRFCMMNVWDGLTHYRDDKWCSPQKKNSWHVDVIFCDDGLCNYNGNLCLWPSKALHINRRPSNIKCESHDKILVFDDVGYGIIHFNHANLENLAIKKAWYLCLEYIYARFC